MGNNRFIITGELSIIYTKGDVNDYNEVGNDTDDDDGDLKHPSY